MAEQMDCEYSKPGFYWGREPNDLCRRVCALVAPDPATGGRAADIGCGEGRDAIHLARHGFDVTAVDISQPGLDKALRWAADEGLRLAAVRASALAYRLSAAYQVVYSSGTLHYLPLEVRAAVFGNYKAFTVPGGVHAVNAFVEKPFVPTPPDYAPNEYFYRSGDLLAHYWDWEVLFFEERIFHCQSGGAPHRHVMDTLIARRVSG